MITEKMTATYGNFHVQETVGEERDNRKIWHVLFLNSQPVQMIDWLPYDSMSSSDLQLYIKCGAPTREDAETNGPLTRDVLNNYFLNNIDKLKL